MKRFNRLECLFKDFHAVNARDNNGGGKTQGILQTLNWSYSLRLQQNAVCHTLHSEHTYFKFQQLRNNQLLKTAIMCVHDVQRHLNRIKLETILFGYLKHVQVYTRIFVTGEPDVANLTGSACFNQGRIRSLVI